MWPFARKLDIFTREISPLLWLHNKSRLSHQKTIKWNDLVFLWCLYNKCNIAWPLGDTKLLFSCWKICHSCFSTLEEKFRISARPCNIPYVFLIPSLFSEGHGGHLGFILMHLFKAYVWSAMNDIDKLKRYPWLDKIWIIRECRARYVIMITTFHPLVLKSERTMPACNFGTQLFQERLSEKVHATIPKGIVVGFEFTVLKWNLKEWQERPRKYVCEC